MIICFTNIQTLTEKVAKQTKIEKNCGFYFYSKSGELYDIVWFDNKVLLTSRLASIEKQNTHLMSVKNLLLYLFLFGSVCLANNPEKNPATDVQQSMIWSSAENKLTTGYTVFRKSFVLKSIPQQAEIKLFADARYLLWINGKYVLRGPCRFNPKRPEYDVVNVSSFLQKGKNEISVLVHSYGNSINGRMMKHAPGLGVVLSAAGKELLRTDSTWHYNNQTRYLASPTSWNTAPDVIDGRIEPGDWMRPAFDHSLWPRAKSIDGNLWGKMFPREIALPKEQVLTGLRLLPSGDALHKSLPIELAAGQEIVVDFGKMAMAYTAMTLDADVNSKLSMKYALRYKDGKPMEMYGAGNSYTAAAGRQSFVTTDQWGSHYMVVKCVTGRVKIENITITDRRYPFARVGSFVCSDTILNKLWDMSVATIEVTSDDGYGSDARERNEWTQDASKPSYTTTRIAFATSQKDGTLRYADPLLLKNMLRHAAQSQQSDGQLMATFPTSRGREDCHFVIEDYSCQWFEALRIYYQSTGDKAFVAEMWPVLQKHIQWYLTRRTTRGLLLAREYTSFDNPLAYITCEGANINAFFYEALRSSEYLATVLSENGRAVEYKTAADALYNAYNKHLWNNTEMAYNSAWYRDSLYNPTSHAQIIALQYNLVPEERKASVRQWFMAHYKNKGAKHCCQNPEFKKMIDEKYGIKTPILYYWIFNELYQADSEATDLEAIGEMRRRWTPMVLYQPDAGTLSESFTDEKGGGANESCHNYGATPAYFLSSYVLGVRRDAPVWKKEIVIEPRLAGLDFAEGTVVTEFGPVAVSWKKSDDGKTIRFSYTAPKGVTVELRLPKVSEKSVLKLNGKEINQTTQSVRRIVVKNAGEKGTGIIWTE